MITKTHKKQNGLKGYDVVLPGTEIELLPWNKFPQRHVVGTVKSNDCGRVLAETNFYLGQRNLNKSRVTDLEKRVRSGLFHVARLCFALTPDRPVLMDGQHSLTAAQQSGRTINFAASEIWCPTRMDLATLFAQHDNGGKRTATHIAHAYAASSGIDMRATTANNVAKGMAMVTWGFDGPVRRATAEDKAANMVQHRDLAVTIGKTIDPDDPVDKVPSFMNKQQIVAVVFMSVRLSSTYAERFWTQVRDGVDLQTSDPAFKLRNWLSRVVVSNSSTVRPGLRRVSSEHLLAQCIEGWNAFRESRAIKLYTKAPAETPIPV